jgi:hypothetical protein
MQAKTIDEVISILNQIVEECKTQNNPLGYFAILYRQVTINVRDGILNNRFENNPRMEKLDVYFANRYFDAYFDYKEHKKITKSWHVAFISAQESHIILQYLLQGINAHINLDLGIATVKTLENDELDGIKKDFYAINTLLSEMVDEVKQKIGSISPIFKLLMPLAKKWDDKIVQFSIEVARDGAWEFAQQLHNDLPNSEKIITERDTSIYNLGLKLVSPVRTLQWILNTIRFFETGTVQKKMEALETKLKTR